MVEKIFIGDKPAGDAHGGKLLGVDSNGAVKNFPVASQEEAEEPDGHQIMTAQRTKQLLDANIADALTGALSDPENELFDVIASALLANGYLPLRDLTLSNATFSEDDPPGTVIGAIRGISIGSTIEIDPNDGRFAIDGSNNLVVGLEDIDDGTINIVLRETLSGPTNSPKDNSISLTVSPGVPINTVLPAISGNFVFGATLSVTTGTWVNSPSSYSYQWTQDGAFIPGATASSYTATTDDIDATIGCLVTATNAAGSDVVDASGSNIIAGLDRTKHVYVGAGQSLMSYPFKRPTNPKVSAYWGKFLQSELLIAGSTTFGTYGATAPFVSHNGANQNATDWTVRVQQASSQGSNFIDVAAVAGITDASEYTGLTNYWVNTQDNTAATGNPADTANSPGPLWRNCISILQAQPRVDSFGWSQGEADASWVGAASGNEVTYKTWLKAFFNAVRTAIDRPDLPIVIHRIGRTDNLTANSVKGTSAIRRIQAEIAAEMDGVVFVEQYGERFANAALLAACSFTNGSQTITTVNTSGLSANASLATQIAGAGIQAGSKVTGITAGVSFTIDKPVMQDGANVTLARIDPVHLYPGATTAAQPLDTDTDGNSSLDYYDTTKGFFQVGRMMARALAKAFKVPDALPYQGPIANSIAATVGQNTIDVTFNHRAGNDIRTRDGRTINASSFGFRVVNNSADLAVTGITRVSATVLRLTLGANLSAGSVSVDVGYGNMPYADVDAALCDNSPLKLPLEAIGPSRAPGLAITV